MTFSGDGLLGTGGPGTPEAVNEREDLRGGTYAHARGCAYG